jgi:chromosome segregation ATPase
MLKKLLETPQGRGYAAQCLLQAWAMNNEIGEAPSEEQWATSSAVLHICKSRGTPRGYVAILPETGEFLEPSGLFLDEDVVRELFNEREGLRNAHTHAQEVCNKLLLENRDLSRKLKEAEVSLIERQDIILELREKLKAAEEETRQLRGRVSDLERERLDSVTQEMWDGKKEEVFILKAAMNAAKDDAEEARRQKDAVRGELDRLQAYRQEMEVETERRVIQLKDIMSQRDLLKEQVQVVEEAVLRKQLKELENDPQQPEGEATHLVEEDLGSTRKVKEEVRTFFEQDENLHDELSDSSIRVLVSRFLKALIECRKELQARESTKHRGMSYYFESVELAKARKECAYIGNIVAMRLLKWWADSD